MPKFPRFSFDLLLAGLILLLPLFGAASETEDGFVSLFDGKSLEGWTIIDGSDDAFAVEDGVIHCPGKDHFPCWLRSEKHYENFDLRYEYRNDGWCNSGILFSAPEHGRNSRVGFEVQIDHFTSNQLPVATSGAIFEVVPPLKNAEREEGEWNQGRILLDWPILKVWVNGELVQDLNVEENDELKYRFRQGYIGLQDCGYPVWFRNIRVKELPAKEKWISLYDGESFDGWYREVEPDREHIAEWSINDGAIRAANGTSYLVTEGEWEDFEFHCYVRAKKNANGGMFIRWNTLVGKDRGREVQIEAYEDSNNPTGSLYHVVRAEMPRIQEEEWFPMQIRVKGKHVVIRVNGETGVDYDNLDVVRKGHISLQMHSDNSWIEWKGLRIKDLSGGS